MHHLRMRRPSPPLHPLWCRRVQERAAILLFAALDADSDGKITLPELREGMIDAGTGHPSLIRLLQVVDGATKMSGLDAAVVVDDQATTADTTSEPVEI